MRFATAALLLIILCLPALAQDPTVVSPEYYSVLLENEYVRVISLEMPPGASDEKHSHPDSLIFYLNDSEVKVHKHDGTSIKAKLKKHTVFYQTAVTHQVTNVGSTPVRAISFELKQPVGGPVEVELAPQVVAPDTNSLLLDNDRVRVVYTINPAGSAGALHEHIQMVAYVVNDSHYRITVAGGEPVERKLPAGSALWIDPVTHALENIGDTDSIVLHVEIK